MNIFKRRMKALKISVYYISNRLGVSTAIVKHYLRDPSGMPFLQYLELCKILDLKLDHQTVPQTLASRYDNFIDRLHLKIFDLRMKQLKHKLKKDEAIYQINDDNLTGLDILYGDYVIVDLNLKPKNTMQDLILYTTSKGPDNIGLYWGRYVNHWAKDCPKFRNARHATVRSIEGVVTAIYNSELKLKTKFDVSGHSNMLQDTLNTISMEPSNLGSLCEPNAQLITLKDEEEIKCTNI